MKRFLFIMFWLLIIGSSIQAQNKKLFVSRQGGTKKIFTWGKAGYFQYRYSGYLGTCDTLICRGSGYETTMIPESNEPYAQGFNNAILSTTKEVRKTKKKSGQFNFLFENQTYSVKYSNADEKGNADIEIEVL